MKEIWVIDVAILGDTRIEEKQSEKVVKYRTCRLNTNENIIPLL